MYLKVAFLLQITVRSAGLVAPHHTFMRFNLLHERPIPFGTDLPFFSESYRHEHTQT